MPLSTSPLTFWEGNIHQFLCKEFEVIDDDEVEGTEEITITLLVVRTVGVDLPPDLGTTILKIIDNDSPVLSPSPSASTSPENDNGNDSWNVTSNVNGTFTNTYV